MNNQLQNQINIETLEAINSDLWDRQPAFVAGSFTCKDGLLWPSNTEYIKARSQALIERVCKVRTPFNFASVMALASR